MTEAVIVNFQKPAGFKEIYSKVDIWPASCEKGPSDRFDAPSKNTGKCQRVTSNILCQSRV